MGHLKCLFIIATYLSIMCAVDIAVGCVLEHACKMCGLCPLPQWLYMTHICNLGALFVKYMYSNMRVET